jgi:nuclear transport factor 2 (NTF2) superfamily protein
MLRPNPRHPKHPPTDKRTRDPVKISKAYTETSIWRNRDQFVTGTAEIQALLTKKWEREINYKLRKELFAFTDNKIAVQFWYEYQDKDDGMRWKRCYGLEDWTFAEDGRMRKRQMSGNDVVLQEGERWYVDGVDVNEVAISEKHW